MAARSGPTMTTTRYPEADTQDTLWPEDRIETLLPAGCFDAEPAGARYARLLRADAPGKGSGADSPTKAWAEHAYTLRELAASRPAHCGRESGNR